VKLGTDGREGERGIAEGAVGANWTGVT
jgi:hypothetical protein